MRDMRESFLHIKDPDIVGRGHGDVGVKVEFEVCGDKNL